MPQKKKKSYKDYKAQKPMLLQISLLMMVHFLNITTWKVEVGRSL